MSADREPPTAEMPRQLDRRSLAGLAVSVVLAVIGLFALPPLRAQGLSFMEAFWTTIAIELVALVGVVLSVMTLYRTPESE